MNKIDWAQILYFAPDEFPENPKHAEPTLIYRLDHTRGYLDKAVYPSPVKGALARFTGSEHSQHYAVDRLSTGVDVFCEGIPIQNFYTILGLKYFNGIGVYLDTNGVDGQPWIMFHLDIRPIGFKIDVPLLWIVIKIKDKITGKVKTKYKYPQLNPEYWSLLRDERLYMARTKSYGKTTKVNESNPT